MSAEQILQSLDIWPESPEIRPISEGYTNQNFRVVAAGKSYFARVAGDLPDHGVLRRNEAVCARQAAAEGIGPRVLYARDGILVTEAIEGSPLCEGQRLDAERLTEIARLLGRLHRVVPSEAVAIADPIAACRGYLARIRNHQVVQSHGAMFREILDTAPDPSSTCFIHGDAFPENFIHDGQRVWLIDWEYAGRGDPAIDLAFVAMNFELPPDQIRDLLDAYGGDVSPSRVLSLISVAGLRDALWCLVEGEIRGFSRPLAEYAERCFRRLGIDYRPGGELGAPSRVRDRRN